MEMVGSGEGGRVEQRKPKHGVWRGERTESRREKMKAWEEKRREDM